MPVANQYGIDYGNIMSTASNIKGARLSRETGEYNLKRKKELDTLADEKRNNEQLGKMAVQLSSLPVEEQQPAFERAVSMLSPEIQDAVKAGNYTAQDLPHIINDALSFDQLYTKVIQNPADLKAKKDLEKYKNDMAIKKEGRVQKGKLELEEVKQKGKEDSPITTSKDERLIKRKLDLEDKVDDETITPREQKELKLVNTSIEKKNQIREGVSERGMAKTNDMMGAFSESTNSSDFFDFSDKIINGSLSISELSTTQKKNLGKIARREQSVTKNRIDKDDQSTLSSLKQTTNVIDVMKGADFRDNYGPIDKYKDDVLKYFRGDENAAKSAMISAFLKASTVNANIKGVPSNADLKLISQGLADKTMNEDQAAKMMVAALEKDLAEAKDTLDRAIVSAPATAIFKYGDVISDLESSISIINQAFGQGVDGKSGGKKTLEELRSGSTTNKTVTRTGMSNGRKVIQYSDGSVEYAD